MSFAAAYADGSLRCALSGEGWPERRKRLTPWARMLTGSAGKTFVAASVLRLVGEGRLRLEDRVADHLGDEPWFDRLPNAREMTLLHLLRHESGLPRYVFDERLWRTVVGDPDHPWTAVERLSFVFDADPLFPAGDGWSYSDTSYNLAGMIVEKATGERFFDFARRELVEPLGLKHTQPTDTRRIRCLTQGHCVSTRTHGLPERTLVDGELVYGPQFEWCGGGWATSASDLALWITHFATGGAFGEEALDALLETVPATPLGNDAQYGLGITLWPDSLGLGLGPMLGHAGVMPGYRSVAAYLPEYEIGLALQVNTDLRIPGGMIVLLRELAQELVSSVGRG